jgi:hypothetical protein
MVVKTKKLPLKAASPPKTRTFLSYEMAIKLAWQRGLLNYKLLPHQVDLFNILSNKKKRKILINCTRRFGKTTTLLIYCFIFGIQNPRSLIRFAAPTQKSLRKSIFPIIRDLIADCPDELKPKWDTQESCYKFPNGSELHVYGTDMQQHDSMRGQRCDLGVIDEAAYCSDLKYIVQDILLPQTLTCNGRILIASTPQKKTIQSGEEFKEFCTEAEINEAYHTKTIYDNTSLSLETIEEYCKESGGAESITWQVEYLCRFMIDPEKRVVPEWKTEKYTKPLQKPDFYNFYHKYVGMDLGVRRDFTVMLFAYYNFHTAQIVILDEWVGKNMNSIVLVDAMKENEQKLFNNLPIYRRVSDSDNPLLLNDLCSLHGLPIIPTSKSTLEAMVNEVRIWINDGRVLVDPKCKFTIACLEKAVWANTIMGQQRRDFARTEALGHFDALAALIYLIRNIDTTTNPIPAHHNIDGANAYIAGSNGYQGPHQEFAKLLTKKVFR